MANQRYIKVGGLELSELMTLPYQNWLEGKSLREYAKRDLTSLESSFTLCKSPPLFQMDKADLPLILSVEKFQLHWNLYRSCTLDCGRRWAEVTQ